MSLYGKRKRSFSSATVSLAAARPYSAPRKRVYKRPFVPGRSRVGGFYGRYSGVKAELKFHDIVVDDAQIATGGVIQNAGTINIIPQGVTEIQRIGRKCTIKSIWWKYSLDIPEIDAQGDPGNGDQVRLILYQDKQCNGATATAGGILETAGGVRSFRNLANQGRFVILMDKLHTLSYQTLASDGAGLVSSSNLRRNWSFYKRCAIPIEFDSTTGALTEIRSNNLGVLAVSAGGIARLQSEFRLRFSDQ